MEQALGAGMGFLVFLAVAAGIGLLIGVLARLALPGPDPMSWLATMGYGLVGSVVGEAEPDGPEQRKDVDREQKTDARQDEPPGDRPVR